MITPTQAQVADNIQRVEWTLEDKTWQPSRWYLEKLLAAYKELAALTAPAQVGEPKPPFDNSVSHLHELAPITAAQEQYDKLMRCIICGFVVDTQYNAEKPTAQRLSSALEPMEWHRRKAVATTIERCKQVAIDLANQSMHGFAQTEYSKIANEIAAAIGKLKDEP